MPLTRSQTRHEGGSVHQTDDYETFGSRKAKSVRISKAEHDLPVEVEKITRRKRTTSSEHLNTLLHAAPTTHRKINLSSELPHPDEAKREISNELLQRNSISIRPASPVDSAVSFFLKPHTITLLLSMLSYFLYVAFYRTLDDTDIYANTKYGLYAVLFVFQIIGTLIVSDGPFVRPHPVIWRMVMSAGISYLLLLVFFLFQSLSMTRYLVSLFDPNLGVPLPEINYASDCSLTWPCIKEKLDFFVFCHAAGWFGKSFIVRDTWLLWIISVLFEVMEYSLMFQLPNFEECWWDHWVLDVLLCNGLGIYVGMKTCAYFKMKLYNWREGQDSNTPSSNKLWLFLPSSWTPFEWASTASFKNYLVAIFLVSFFLTAELNAFYLKHLLWVPPNHLLNWIRVILIGLMGLLAFRDIYDYFYPEESDQSSCSDHPRRSSDRLGSSAWLMIAIICTEVIVIVKFGKDEFPWIPPPTVRNFWLAFFALLIVYPIFRFVLFPGNRVDGTLKN